MPAPRQLLTPARGLRRAWRRSLQLRVVATTLAVSGVVVIGLGMVLVGRITDGLVDAKRTSALYEAETGQTYARQQLQALRGPNDADLQRTLYGVGGNLSARAGRAGQFGVVLVPTSDPALPPVYSSQLVRSAVHIPAGLTRRVVADNVFSYQFTRMAPDGGTPRPTLVVGAPVVTASGSFELYYLFPLDDELSTVGLVQNTLIAAGLVLVLLVVGVAAIVTRQVVTPVRVAARTAERLSAGLLEERMRVVGEDEFARLAKSFNHMAANIQRQIVQLEDLSRLQRRFTSDVSHELRTPLTTVRMAADVLFSAREEFDPPMRRAAELLQTEVDRFESLLTDLLEISRYDAGFAVLEAEPTDLGELVRQAADFIEPLARRAGTELVVTVPDRPVIAEVDPRRVRRVLRNLLVNAIEHGEGRPVDLVLARDARAAGITVRDRGVGFKPGEAQLVFNRFWRADASRARQTGGTGLGLSISLEDARLHGGWLQAWGGPGRGAQFRLTLPLDAGSAITASPLPLVPADAVPGSEPMPVELGAGTG
ncbi:MAG TPA: MtrAB system histidine kinase MtrB [Mycobacteriales bacterium]|nr:MtrAB system histidine kinase MtrB [Mycobacteriales bacterium]